MTKTQANEPGFVQLPDGWLAIEMKVAEAEIAKWPAGLRASFESLFLAAAPIVPAPAYGVKEALDPFAKVARWLADDVRDDAVDWPEYLAFSDAPALTPDMPTVADLRHAYATYYAIGIGAERQGLTIAALQRAHVERQEEWCPDQKPDLSFRGNEMAGEVGEACNVIKKLERERHGWRGSRATINDLGDELADTIHTAILCAITAGIDLEPRVFAKFNATSDKNGLTTRLSSAPVEEADAKACHHCKGVGGFEDNECVMNPCAWCRGSGIDPDQPASTIPSEPEAKGEAGAGPGGEAVAGWLSKAVHHLLPNWNIYSSEPVRCSTVKGVPDEYYLDPRLGVKQWDGNDDNLSISLMVENDPKKGGRWIEQSFTPEQAVQIVASILSKPAVEPHVAPLLAALFGSPVEEPGEVERDEAPQTDGGFLTKGERAAIDKLGEAEALRRELAETREHLQNLLAATGKARTALAGFTSVDDAAFALDVAIGDLADWKRRAVLSTQESSAALAGDGKETGR